MSTLFLNKLVCTRQNLNESPKCLGRTLPHRYLYISKIHDSN